MTRAKSKRPASASSRSSRASSRRKNPGPARPTLAQADALLSRIRAGVRVRFLVPAGIGRAGVEWKPVTGRAVMPAAGGGWVVNLGGKHGRPGVVTAGNIVDVLGGAKRSNPPLTVKVHQFGGKRGHLVGLDVFAIEYKNAGSAQRSAYRHDFDSRGIELWALVDGSLLIRHKSRRLWDDFTVTDSE